MSAKDDFTEGIREVRVLIKVSDIKRAREADDAVISRANAARRASVVLLTAHFESYLKSIAEDFVDYLSSGTLESRAIPPALRDLHTMSLVKKIQNSSSLTERTAHFKKLSQVAQLWNNDAKPSRGALRAEVLSREVTSAKPDKIDLLFQIMGGAGQVCDGDIDLTLPDVGLSTLNIRRGVLDVVECRDDIAHGDTSRKPTSQDVERYVALLEALADRLDRKGTELKQRIVIPAPHDATVSDPSQPTAQ